MYIDLNLPESAENMGLFQLRSTLRSDAGVALHTTNRPLALPHRSQVVSTLRDVALFPLYLTGLLSESIRLRRTVAENFVEAAAAPLAAVEVTVTGARPVNVPPIIHGGAITVDVQMSAVRAPFACSNSPVSRLPHACHHIREDHQSWQAGGLATRPPMLSS